ncbi:MAG: glycosyltransferase family 4 protein [Candidatus Korobacteraceae bacterium]
MRVALVAPPFLPVPPLKYGGTELFIAQLAEGLQNSGVEVVVYTNGASTVGVEKRWLYHDEEWPLTGHAGESLKDLNHASWAVHDAASCDVIHLHNSAALMFTRYVNANVVYTVHHLHEPPLSEIYSFFPLVEYVMISDYQHHREKMLHMRTIHHGIDLSIYRLRERKQDYLCFLGRLAPIKGAHIAIEVARKSGIPLKIAGEIQPIFQDYFDQQIKPHLDDRFIEYVGEVDLAGKNELLGNSLAMLFPIQWDEPFGLVMIEAMACGTPVLALPGGSVSEVVRDGVSGYCCRTPQEMAVRACNLPGEFDPVSLRQYCQRYFSLERMVAEYLGLYQEMMNHAMLPKIPSSVPLVA